MRPLRGQHPREHCDPFGQMVEGRQALRFEQTRQLKPVPQSEPLRDRLGRADGALNQYDCVDHGARQQRQVGTDAVNRGQQSGKLHDARS